MENSFFSGSENLYKYLVTVGILLIVLTVYYPLKEKQDLEVLSIKTKNDLKILEFKIDQNEKEVANFSKRKEGIAINIAERLRKIQFENKIQQIELENKVCELQTRDSYIALYRIIFWIFFPVGIVLIIYGFIKWHKSKRIDDDIRKLEKIKLEKEINNIP